MPISTGANIAAKSNIILSYDTGDTINSYIGEPTTNICTGEAYSIYNDGATNHRNQTSPLPPKSGYEVVKVVANTPGVYGQSILWRALYNSTPAVITNSVYAWLESGTYVQVGQHWFPWNYGSPKYIPKGQWVRISETYTINEGGSYEAAAMVYSTDGVAYFAMPQYEFKSHMTPFIGFNQTRSVTQSLYPLISNQTLDLTNVSYDSNAQIFFDGTDDLIDITTNFGILNAYTFEYVSYSNAAGKMPVSTRTSTAFYKYGAYSWKYRHGGVDGEFYHTAGSNTGWAHWVITYDGSIISVYENGISKGIQASSGTADFSEGIRIGSWTSSPSYTWNGTIPIMKMYNSALSKTEIQQNYQQYKTRFNL